VLGKWTRCSRLENAWEGKIKQAEKIIDNESRNVLKGGFELRTIADLELPLKEQGPGLIIHQYLNR
jgi:hypothetical protein